MSLDSREYKQVGSSNLTVSTSSVGFADAAADLLATYPKAVLIVCSVEAAGKLWFSATGTGASLTGANGEFSASQGDVFAIAGRPDLVNFECIRDTGESSDNTVACAVFELA